MILLEGGGLEYEARTQDLYRGEIVGLPYYPLQAARRHHFGGDHGALGWLLLDLRPQRLREAAVGSSSGWPITRASRPLLCSCPSGAGARAIRVRSGRVAEARSQPHPLSAGPARGVDDLWQFSPPTRFGTKYREPIFSAHNVHLFTYANVCEVEANEA